MNRNKLMVWLTIISLASLVVGCAAPAAATTETQPATADPQGQLPATLDPDVLPTEFLPTLAPTASLAATGAAPTETPAATAASSLIGTPEPGTATSLKPTATLSPQAWRLWPIIPAISPHMQEIYQKGLALGNDPHSFSKVGDCQNILLYYLSFYDTPGEYRLGQYSALQDTIDYYKGSFGRNSRAVRGGFNVASVLSPFWADPAQCTKEENPLACEFRIHQPSVAIISMETWWSGKPATEYEGYLRKIVEFSLAHGTVPILATKADNFEGDNSINAAIARVAVDYDVPLWNFWRAVQPLPSHGLTPDGFHLTFARPYFDDPVRMQMAWPVRNLTALQALDAVRVAVTK